MYRVELKVPPHDIPHQNKSLFLMYRVELKGFLMHLAYPPATRFLMYRVELKVIWRKIQIGSGRSS